MRKQLGIKLIAAGTIIGANVSAYPIAHANAEEITILENAAELQSVSIEEFNLDQEFSPDVKEYTASVGNDIKTMNLLVEKKEEAAAITVNGEEIDSGVKTSLPLSTGENEFVITVTNGTEVSSYSMVVVRAKNDNNLLSNLSLSNGNFNFDPEKTDYHIEVKNEISKLTLKPNAEADTSAVTINGTNVKGDDGYDTQLPVGSTTFTIIVTAENGNKKTYTVTVVREVEQTSSSNDIEEEKEQSVQDPSTVETSSKNNNSEVTPTQAESNNRGTNSSANVDVLAVSNDSSTKSTESFGSSSTTSISETKTTANLDSLSVSDGTWNKTFSSDSYTYHISLGNDVKTLTLSADSEESSAEIFIEDEAISDNSTVPVGDKAKTAVSIVVKNDEDRKTYVLIFEKDIEEVITEAKETSDNTEVETTTVSSKTDTEDNESMKESTANNQMNVRAERQAENPSFWQKLLSFFGL
ncbi:hypothetical protein CJ195_10445 [Bacillus sp. UMB0899]|nr:hypothetical protein CJ195_10445 [Bacillus sp. UMB0899]